jgi:hypothetical protein
MAELTGAIISSAVIVTIAIIGGVVKLTSNLTELRAEVKALRQSIASLRAQWQGSIRRAMSRHIRRHHGGGHTGEVRRDDQS